jgi:aminopeptidase N
VLALSLLLAFAATAASGDRQIATGWTLTRADLDLHVDPEAGTLQATARLTVLLEDAMSSQLTLGMNSREPTMRFVRVEAGDVEVMLNERHPDAEFARLAVIRFEQTHVKGDEVELEVEWSSTGSSTQFAVTPEAALASWVEAWYPVPVTDIGRITERMRAPGSTRIEMPSGWHAVSNGQLVHSEPSAAGVVDTWEIDVPVARSFVAAPYQLGVHSVDEREFRVYLLSAEDASAEIQARTLAGSITAMEQRWGPYPYSTFSIAEIPDGVFSWYAASEQGFIVAASRAFDVEGGNVPLFAHEAAHSWWGNLVTTDGPGALLVSESLAQYGAVIAIEALEGAEAAADFLRFSRQGYSTVQSALGFFHLWRDGKDRPLSQLDGSGSDHNLSDAKGHWVYHMLRQQIGDDVFFATLREIVQDHSGSSLSLEELRAAFLDRAPPEAELEGFFAQWLDRTGAPVLRIDWWSIRRGKAARLAVQQLQPGDPYDLDLEVEIRSRDGSVVRHVVAVSGPETIVDVATDDHPVDLRADPDHRLLMWRPEYGPRPVEIDSTAG